MRSQDEIAARMTAKQKEPLNFEPEVLFCYLCFDAARPFLKGGVTQEQFGAPKALTDVLLDAEEYMGRIGWTKCMDQRGISAWRTIQKMTAWMWLLGDAEAVAFINDDANYGMYGAPALRYLCERHGWAIPDGAP
jgi:hypothetical protein